MTGRPNDMFRASLAASLALCLQLAWAGTYEDFFTAKGRTYDEDPWVWVYTRQFAERFGMPEAWIDDRLKGAYAVAYRVEHKDTRMILTHKGPDVGMRHEACYLDVYLPSDAPVPWISERRMGRRYGYGESPFYIVPQSEEDLKILRAPVGVRLVGLRWVSGGSKPAITVHYERGIYPAIDFVSFSVGCGLIPRSAAHLEFEISKGPRDIKRELVYTVDMPKSYMERVADNWDRKVQRRFAEDMKEILKK
ncbi:hypothetical protein [Thiohalobacter sp.]|uniref:hypothetical protein n=1 Tax=Thiohalobacter sp. TaxID=2025948 RepID=UPI00260FE79A|nr:hypothetical protein [Thiohalobacter sp.]